MGKVKIDESQFVVLLVLSKIFTLLTFSTHSREQSGIYIEMLGYLGAVIVQMIVMIPIFILFKRNKECGIIECSFKVNKYYGGAVTLLFIAILLFQTANTIAGFEFFMTTAIYPSASAWVFIVIFLIAVMYSAYMGIEAFSRMGGFVLVFVILGSLVLVLSNWEQINFVYLQNPFQDGIKPLFNSIYQQSNVVVEIILYMLIMPYVGGESVIKPAMKFFLISTVYFEVVIAVVLLSLGNMANNEMFPIFTMAVISEMAFLERLDAIYVGIWIFIAFVRTSTLIFISAQLLKHILPAKISSQGIIICGTISFFMSMYFSRNIEALTKFSQIIFAGLVMAVFVIGIPMLTLFLTWKRNEVQSK